MKKLSIQKKKNKIIFISCGYISILNRKLYEFFEKIFIKCAYISDQTKEIEKIEHFQKVEQNLKVGETIVEHKEEIVEHYQSLYSTIEECEKDNDFLAKSLLKSYVLFKNKQYDELDKFFKEINLEYYLNP